jgi:hypothetical protein
MVAPQPRIWRFKAAIGGYGGGIGRVRRGIRRKSGVSKREVLRTAQNS